MATIWISALIVGAILALCEGQTIMENRSFPNIGWWEDNLMWVLIVALVIIILIIICSCGYMFCFRNEERRTRIVRKVMRRRKPKVILAAQPKEEQSVVVVNQPQQQEEKILVIEKECPQQQTFSVVDNSCNTGGQLVLAGGGQQFMDQTPILSGFSGSQTYLEAVPVLIPNQPQQTMTYDTVMQPGMMEATYAVDPTYGQFSTIDQGQFSTIGQPVGQYQGPGSMAIINPY